MSTITRSTFRLIAVAATVAALTFAGGGIANAKTGGVPAIPLNNEQAGVPDTGASGFLSYNITGSEFCYRLVVRHLSSPSIPSTSPAVSARAPNRPMCRSAALAPAGL